MMIIFLLFRKHTGATGHVTRHPSIYVPAATVWDKVTASFSSEESPLVAYFLTHNQLRWA